MIGEANQHCRSCGKPTDGLDFLNSQCEACWLKGVQQILYDRVAERYGRDIADRCTPVASLLPRELR